MDQYPQCDIWGPELLGGTQKQPWERGRHVEEEEAERGVHRCEKDLTEWREAAATPSHPGVWFLLSLKIGDLP